MLRGYQEDIKRRVVDAWEHHRSVLVQMPTGTGKTVVLASLVNDHLRINGEESENPTAESGLLRTVGSW